MDDKKSGPIYDGLPVTTEDESLLKAVEAEKLKGIERIEGAAKYLTTMVGAVTGLCITGQKLTGKVVTGGRIWLNLGLLLFALSLVISVLVYLPLPWNYRKESPSSIARVFRRLLWWKWCCMMVSVVLYGAGCFALAMLLV